jgi:hypothetical protein
VRRLIGLVVAGRRTDQGDAAFQLAGQRGSGHVEPLLRRAADHEIRTTIPLTDVVAEVVHLAGLSPGSHGTLDRSPADGGP